jgi:hypothetical protein
MYFNIATETCLKHAVPQQYHASNSRSPSASEVSTAYTVSHTHTQRLIERRQSVRYILPRVPTSIDFLTAVARGHRP